MNKKLKFSWGHIVAFLVLIFIGYITFMGVTYASDGNFSKAGIETAIILVVLILFFIGAQYMKGVDEKFRKSIVWERIFMYASPLVFIICMTPYSHFWTVFNNGEEITKQFDSAIELSKNMYVDYDEYAHKRINNYQAMLNRIVSNKSLRPQEYRDLGFTGRNDNEQKQMMVKELELQLLSSNYNSLKTTATDWIDNVKGASVWNVFIIGNIKQIKTSMGSWNKDLASFAAKKINNEEYKGYNTVEVYSDHGKEISKVETALDNLKGLYTESSSPTPTAIITGILCYILLLFPYFIQRRNTKNIYRLFGQEGGHRTIRDADEYLGGSQKETNRFEHRRQVRDAHVQEQDTQEKTQVNQPRQRGGLHGRIRME